jgi:hypothetical protein
MIAWRQVGHIVSNGLHDPGRLVTQHTRQIGVVFPLEEVQIAVAKSRGCNPNEDLAWARIVDNEIHDFELTWNFELHRCPHEYPNPLRLTTCQNCTHLFSLSSSASVIPRYDGGTLWCRHRPDEEATCDSRSGFQ